MKLGHVLALWATPPAHFWQNKISTKMRRKFQESIQQPNFDTSTLSMHNQYLTFNHSEVITSKERNARLNVRFDLVSQWDMRTNYCIYTKRNSAFASKLMIAFTTCTLLHVHPSSHIARSKKEIGHILTHLQQYRCSFKIHFTLELRGQFPEEAHCS